MRQPSTRLAFGLHDLLEALFDARGAASDCAAGTPCRSRTRPALGQLDARLLAQLPAETRAASGSECPRRRRCSPRSRRRRDDRGSSRIWSACSRISCDLRPLMSTTKPTPQASCSNGGSYRPCFPAGWSDRDRRLRCCSCSCWISAQNRISVDEFCAGHAQPEMTPDRTFLTENGC